MKKCNLKLFTILIRCPYLLLLLAVFLGSTHLLKAQVDFYFTPPNGWSMERHVRTMGDVNGDGFDDIVGFGEKGVFVSFSDGKNFSVPKMLIDNFAIGAGKWTVSLHTRVVADVNGDGKADVVGFGDKQVWVALSEGKSFSPKTVWLDHYFTTPNGWNNQHHVRTAIDVNGDGMADLVGFGTRGVFVSFSQGNSFGQQEMLVDNFAIGAGGWEVSKHTRVLGDINGDAKADIIGFGGSVIIDLSQGKVFGKVEAKRDLDFYVNPNQWNLKRHRRMVADVNGDGKADIVGFAENTVYLSLSNCDGFNTQKRCFDSFTNAQGWSPEKYPISMGDVNGDGRVDIVGFKDNRVYVAFSKGTGFMSKYAVSFK